MITEEEYNDKMIIISQLMEKVSELTDEESRQLDELASEVEEYEDDRYPMPMKVPEEGVDDSYNENAKKLAESLLRSKN